MFTKEEVEAQIAQTDFYSGLFTALGVINGSNYSDEIGISYKKVIEDLPTEDNLQVVVTAMLDDVKARIIALLS